MWKRSFLLGYCFFTFLWFPQENVTSWSGLDDYAIDPDKSYSVLCFCPPACGRYSNWDAIKINKHIHIYLALLKSTGILWISIIFFEQMVCSMELKRLGITWFDWWSPPNNWCHDLKWTLCIVIELYPSWYATCRIFWCKQRFHVGHIFLRTLFSKPWMVVVAMCSYSESWNGR